MSPGEMKGDAEQTTSWWARHRGGRVHLAAVTLGQLALYFGLPLTLLTVLALKNQPEPLAYSTHMQNVIEHYDAGRIAEAISEAELAAVGVTKRVDSARAAVDRNPTKGNYIDLGEMLYSHAAIQKTIADLRNQGTQEQRREMYQAGISQAISALDKAIAAPLGIRPTPAVRDYNPEVQIAEWRGELESR